MFDRYTLRGPCHYCGKEDKYMTIVSHLGTTNYVCQDCADKIEAPFEIEKMGFNYIVRVRR